MERRGKVGLIVLAAGESVRLGTPKQLLKFRGETLLRRITRESLASVCRPVIVVLGAKFEKIADELKDLSVCVAVNQEWEKGMGSSIKIGVENILQVTPEAGGVLLAVCDQPFVTAATIDRLVETFEKSDASIVASEYESTLGVPAIFAAEIFPHLLNLKSGGAKEIIEQFRTATITFPFAGGAIDVDTPDDYLRLCFY